MQQESSAIQYIFTKTNSIEKMSMLPALMPFDSSVCAFLGALADAIRQDKEAKAYPDIVTFGFFCRKAHLEQMKKEYDCDNRLGRGLSFHIAPSNVPINFAYSMVAGLLAGNACVVRVSEKGFVQTDIMARLLHDVCKQDDDFNRIGSYISLITYPKTKEITDYISGLCDMRIIWGGDQTIETIRKSALPPRSGEITFADRYSLLVVDAKAVLEQSDLGKIAGDFFNDTFLFDQNACSSPRLIYWIGDNEAVAAAKDKFWNAIYRDIEKRYRVEPKIAVDKLVAAYKAAADRDVTIIRMGNLIQRIQIDELSLAIREYNAPGGSFFEYQSMTYDDLFAIIDQKVQTVSYFGDIKADLAKAIKASGVHGVDRIVPIGKTADFSLIWDGYDLIKTMSRVVYHN